MSVVAQGLLRRQNRHRSPGAMRMKIVIFASVLVLIVPCGASSSSKTLPLGSLGACLQAASADAKQYLHQTCKSQVKMGKGMGQATMAMKGEGIATASNTKNTDSGGGSSNSTAAFSSKGTNSTGGDGFPKQLPNSTYDERITLLKGLLAQGEDGTLINGTTPCGPWTEYFDFTVQLMTYMLGNVGSGIGRIAGTALGQAAGASIGQSAGLVAGTAASTVLMPAEEAALKQGTEPRRQQQQRQMKQRPWTSTKQPQPPGREGQQRRQQQEAARPVDDATAGLAGGSGIGLGAGFGIGTPAGAAAGRQYGERIGKELAVWIINNVNFAIAYFGCLVLADVMNGVDLVVTDGINREKIQKIIRSQIQAMEDQIFQDFTSVYNATVYEDFSNLELESAVFTSVVDALRGMGVILGFAGGMPVGAAVGASAGGIYGSAGAAAAGASAKAAGASRKAQTASLAEDLAAIDPLVAIPASMWGGTSIGVGAGTAIGVGAGISGGWQLSSEIGYAMGLLMVKFLIKGFALFQQVYGQTVVDQIEQAIFDASAIRINITYTPMCNFSDYHYIVRDVSYYARKSLNPVKGNESEDGDKAGGKGDAINSNGNSTGGEETVDLVTKVFQLLLQAQTQTAASSTGETATAQTVTPPASAFYTRKASSFSKAAAAGDTRAQQTQAAYKSCENYAKSEMYRQKSLCYLS